MTPRNTYNRIGEICSTWSNVDSERYSKGGKVRVNSEKPKLWSFLAWPVVGAALAVSVLGALTIGAYILPFALLGLFILLKWGGDRRSSVGLISGVGLPLLYVAYLNRDGPGWVCRTYGNGGQTCEDAGSPWPWLLIGTALVVTGVLLFERVRRQKYLPP